MRTRTKDRRKVEIPGQCSTVQGRVLDVAILDLTDAGCRFANVEPPLMVRTAINLMIGGQGPFKAHVRWTLDGDVGVSFARPFTADQVEAMISGDHGPVRAALSAQQDDSREEFRESRFPLRSVC